MSAAIGNTTTSISQHLRHAMDTSRKAFQEGYTSMGQKVRTFQDNVLPRIVLDTKDAALHVLKNYFFILPSLAFAFGHYNDASLSTLVCGISAINHLSNNDREVRQFCAVFVGMGLAVNIAIKTYSFATSGSSFLAASLIIQAICLAKLVLIGNGNNFVKVQS
ncbi:MAG: hypothetical protein LLF94_04865 [Chlamydiales bacterium]|nr:hypothetical protein [Chlamydiales bacterium]